MELSDEEGESSTQTNDVGDSDERPLKKARYVWQIKGKYHLKPEEENKDTASKNSSENSPAGENSGLVNTSTPSDVDSSSTLMEEAKETCTSPVNSDKTTTDEDSGISTPLSQEVADTFSQWELKKWQDRQIARCYLDNTINRVLDVMGFVPLPFDADDISDEEFLMQNHASDDDVEDEAVLMAIHSHGLQRSEQNGQESQSQSQQSGDENKISIVPCICSQQASSSLETQILDPFHQRPVLFHLADLDQPGQANAPCLENGQPVLPGSVSARKKASASRAARQSHLEDCREEVLNEILNSNSFESDWEMATQLHSPGSIDIMNLRESQPTEPIQPILDNISSPSLEHNDFLDQAVGVAIQKKGLSTLSMELG